MKADEDQDGPDGLHRLHHMLTKAYGVEIPIADYRMVLYLLKDLGVSFRGAVALMNRFTRNPVGRISEDVIEVMLDTDKASIDEVDFFRVQKHLNAYGYSELSKEVFSKLVGANTPESTLRWANAFSACDPQNTCIPLGLRKCWKSLVGVFPQGIKDQRDYVTLLAVLKEAGFSSMEIEIVASEITDRTKELVVNDIEALGTVLIATEGQKSTLLQQLSVGGGLRD